MTLLPSITLVSLCSVAIWLWGYPMAGSRPTVPSIRYTPPDVHPEALAAWEEGNTLLQQDPHTGSSERGAPPTLLRAIERYEYAEAHSIIQQLTDINSRVRNCAFQIAVVYAGLGDEEHALGWLEQAYKTHQMHVPFMTVDYRFGPLIPVRFLRMTKRVD